MKKRKISRIIVASALFSMTLGVLPSLTSCQFIIDRLNERDYEAAKEEAEDYLASLDSSLYSGIEKNNVDSRIRILKDLISRKASAKEILIALHNLKAYAAYAQTTKSKLIAAAVEEAEDYLVTLDLNIYRNAEKNNIQNSINSLNSTIAAKNDYKEILNKLDELKVVISNSKTDLEYRKEEEIAADEALAAAKEEKIATIDFKDPTQYRLSEYSRISIRKRDITKALYDCKNVGQIYYTSTDPFFNEIANCKTNANYTLMEMQKYGQLSEWDLVTEHKDSWKFSEEGIETNTLDGYVIDSTSYGTKLTAVFNLETNENILTNSGMFLGHHDSEGGLEGYLINFDFNNYENNHQYIQVFYLNHAYWAGPDATLQYLGGWIYQLDYPGEKVAGTDFRYILDGRYISIYKEKDYQNIGESAPHVDVDLTANGSFNLYDDIHVGLVHWNQKAFTAKLKMLAGENVLYGNKIARDLAKDAIANVNLDKYSLEDQETIINLMSNLSEKINYETYYDILASIDEFNSTIKNL